MNCHDTNPFIVMLFASFLLCGCGTKSTGPVDMGGEDGSKIALLVEDLNEVKHNAKKLADSFSVKPTSADAKKLNNLTFYIKGKPMINGAIATCCVQIEKQDGTPLGDVEWGFEKQADAWKIKSAPMP